MVLTINRIHIQGTSLPAIATGGGGAPHKFTPPGGGIFDMPGVPQPHEPDRQQTALPPGYAGVTRTLRVRVTPNDFISIIDLTNHFIVVTIYHEI